MSQPNHAPCTMTHVQNLGCSTEHQRRTHPLDAARSCTASCGPLEPSSLAASRPCTAFSHHETRPGCPHRPEPPALLHPPLGPLCQFPQLLAKKRAIASRPPDPLLPQGVALWGHCWTLLLHCQWCQQWCQHCELARCSAAPCGCLQGLPQELGERPGGTPGGVAWVRWDPREGSCAGPRFRKRRRGRVDRPRE